MKARKEIDPSGQLLFLPQFCPWTSHLHVVERELEISEPILYVVFGDTTGGWYGFTLTDPGMNVLTEQDVGVSRLFLKRKDHSRAERHCLSLGEESVTRFFLRKLVFLIVSSFVCSLVVHGNEGMD